MSVLPWSRTLLADWQPQKPFMRDVKQRLTDLGYKKVTQPSQLADALHAASRFPLSFRATFRIVEGPMPEGRERAAPKAKGSRSRWQLVDKEDPITGRKNTAAILDSAGNVSGDGLKLIFQCVNGRLDFWLTMKGATFQDDFPDGRAAATIVEYRRNDSETGSFILGIGRDRKEATQPNAVIAAGFAVMQGLYKNLRKTALVTDPAKLLDFFTSSSLLVLRAKSSFTDPYVSRFRPRDGGAVRAHLAACLK